MVNLGGFAISAKDLQLVAKTRPCTGRNIILLVSSLDTARTHSGRAAFSRRCVGVRTATEVGIPDPDEGDEAGEEVEGIAMEDSTTVERRKGPFERILSRIYGSGTSSREVSNSRLVKSNP